MSLSHACARSILIACNLLVISIAACAFGCAAVDLSIRTQYGEEDAVSPLSTLGDSLIIALSVLKIMMAVTCLLDAMKKSKNILYYYVLFLPVFMLLDVICGIWFYLVSYDNLWLVKDWLRKDFYSNNLDVQRWDNLQRVYQCCGLNGRDDYAAIPISCCRSAHLAWNQIAQKNMLWSCLQQNYFSNGCGDAVVSHLRNNAVAIMQIQVVGFLFKLCSACIVGGLMIIIYVCKRTVYLPHNGGSGARGRRGAVSYS